MATAAAAPYARTMSYASSRSASFGGAIGGRVRQGRDFPFYAGPGPRCRARHGETDSTRRQGNKDMTGLIAPQTASVPAGSEGTAQQDHFDPLGVPRGRRTSKSGTTSAPIGPQHPVDHIGGDVRTGCGQVPVTERGRTAGPVRGLPTRRRGLLRWTVTAGPERLAPRGAIWANLANGGRRWLRIGY